MRDPLVLDIKGNSLDDGFGVRTVVFFKGCPLSCIWCHNPESKKVNKELSFDSEACINCGTCRSICKKNALSMSNKYYVDRSKCDMCFSCTKSCPSKALSVVGEEMTVEDILDVVLKDKIFFDISGGGLTVSGGEATMFPEFVGELLKKCKQYGVHTLLETCGFFDYNKVRAYMLPYLDHIYFDLKIHDREKHKKYCGVYNDKILENFKKLLEDSKTFGFSILPRTPLIPEICDTDENLIGNAKFLKELGVTKSQLLPYNPTWYPKTHKLGLEEPTELSSYTGFQSKEKIEHCKQIYRDYGIQV